MLRTDWPYNFRCHVISGFSTIDKDVYPEDIVQSMIYVVDMIPDPEIREIVQHIYAEGMTFEETAKAMHRSDWNVEILDWRAVLFIRGDPDLYNFVKYGIRNTLVMNLIKDKTEMMHAILSIQGDPKHKAKIRGSDIRNVLLRDLNLKTRVARLLSQHLLNDTDAIAGSFRDGSIRRFAGIGRTTENQLREKLYRLGYTEEDLAFRPEPGMKG